MSKVLSILIGVLASLASVSANAGGLTYKLAVDFEVAKCDSFPNGETCDGGVRTPGSTIVSIPLTCNASGEMCSGKWSMPIVRDGYPFIAEINVSSIDGSYMQLYVTVGADLASGNGPRSTITVFTSGLALTDSVVIGSDPTFNSPDGKGGTLTYSGNLSIATPAP